MTPDSQFTEWQRRGLEKAAANGKASIWWGGWWNEGSKWNRKRISLVCHAEWHGPELRTIRNYGRIAKKFETSRARDTFPVRHLDAVCSLALPVAEKLLEEGQKKGWKSYELRLAVIRLRSGNRVEDHDPDFTLEDLIARDETFGTIYADCPWEANHPTIQKRIEVHYETMRIEQLCALPIRKLARREAHLHLWVPMSFLELGFEVMRAWGFEYAGSGLVWAKDGRFGPGNFWRETHELLLLGMGPAAKRFNNGGLRSWVIAPRSKIHSEKPAIVREMIERASPGPRLELFGRHQVEGWKVWGNQTIRPKDDQPTDEKNVDTPKRRKG